MEHGDHDLLLLANMTLIEGLEGAGARSNEYQLSGMRVALHNHFAVRVDLDVEVRDDVPHELCWRFLARSHISEEVLEVAHFTLEHNSN